jgi:prolyl-tRNA synthetase
MRQSQLFTHSLKELPKDETSFNAQTLMRAGFIDKASAGVYSYLPLGLRVLQKIQLIVRQEMAALGAQEVLLPSLTTEEPWKQTGRLETFDVLFKTSGTDKKSYILAPTHEEIITPLVKKFAQSYRDLPVGVYQIQTKFRNELRAKSGLLRGREFLMKDLYSFHLEQDDLNAYYLSAQKAYFQIFKRCGLLDQTYLTFASGGDFCQYSHEFQTVTEAGEDTIFVCEECNLAINKEIINEQSVCPNCGKKDLLERRAIEIGNIFKLGARFSKSFNMMVTGADGGKQPVLMGCYGLGIDRLMGTVVEVNHDNHGLIWPKEIAPFKAHLLDLATTEGGHRQAQKLYDLLLKLGMEVLWDDRKNLPAGAKFAEADLIGCPYRLVISDKTIEQKSFEIKRRQDTAGRLVGLDQVSAYFGDN